MYNRITLLLFIRCLAILYHVKISTENLTRIILRGSKKQIITRLEPLSTKLDVSPRLLSAVLAGDKKPFQHLLEDTKLILPTKRYQCLLSSLKKTRLSYVKKRLISKKVVTHYSTERINMLNYLRCLVKLKKSSFSKLCQTMGYQSNEFKKIILQDSIKDIINESRQLPFIFKTASLNNLQLILKGSFHPQAMLLKTINQEVHDRKTLQRYIQAAFLLKGVSLSGLSRLLNLSISTALQKGSGNQLTRLFQQISFLFHIPNNQFQAALARANLQDANHSYLARMHFIIHYLGSPINYQEAPKAHHFDRKRIAHGFRRLRKRIHADQQKQPSHIHVKDSVWLIISGWSFMFNFSASRLVADNFKHFDIKNPQTAQIKQGDHFRPINHSADWLVILHKLHAQIKTVKHAFNLTAVQKGPYGNVVYIKGIGNLCRPKAKDFRTGLARLQAGRYLFTGKFVRTGIKVIARDNDASREYYVPTLLIKNVKYHHQVVAKQVWFNYSKSFVKLGQLENGDLLSFKARIHRYLTGHVSKHSIKVINYELNYPTSIKLVRRIHARTMMPMPKDQATLTGYAIENNHSAAYDFSYRNYRYARYCKNKYTTWQEELNQQKHVNKGEE